MLYPRTLYLLRHAETVEAETGLADFDRALTEAGRTQCVQVAEQLADTTFDMILCSAAKRTVETVELALPGHKFMKLRQLYNASAPGILEIMAENVPSRARKVLLVAHNPGISDLTRQFIADAPHEVQGLHPASLAVFEVAGEWNALKPATSRLQSFFDSA